MFKSDGLDGRGYIAKLVDFGLSIHTVRRGVAGIKSTCTINVVIFSHKILSKSSQRAKEGSKTHISRMFQGTLSHMVRGGKVEYQWWEVSYREVTTKSTVKLPEQNLGKSDRVCVRVPHADRRLPDRPPSYPRPLNLAPPI